MGVQKTGDWALAKRLLSAAPLKLKAAIDTSLRQEAQLLRKEIVQGLTSQAPGGKALPPPSPLTLAARRLRKFKGTKALMVRGDLRNAITTVVRHGEAFVGVPRKARGKDGQPTIDIAKLNEFGSDPIIIPMSPKMRRYLFAPIARQASNPNEEAARAWWSSGFRPGRSSDRRFENSAKARRNGS